MEKWQKGREFFIQNMESVHSQSYPNIEHIVIDGASDDGTIELLEEYQKKGWIKYYSEPDNGIYDAFNKGIMRAEGKYINFLNSDDFFNNNDAVKISVEKLEETDAAFSYGTASLMNKENQIYLHFEPTINRRYQGMPFCHQTMFTKTEVLKKEGMFDLKYTSASDYDFIIRICLKGYKFCDIKENIVTFRVIGESAINEEVSLAEQKEIYKTLYGKHIKLKEEEWDKIMSTRILPIKLLLKMHIKDPSVYNTNFSFKRLRRKIITFKYTKGKGIQYFRILGRDIIKKQEENKE